MTVEHHSNNQCITCGQPVKPIKVTLTLPKYLYDAISPHRQSINLSAMLAKAVEQWLEQRIGVKS